jgi:hypothetical protein
VSALWRQIIKAHQEVLALVQCVRSSVALAETAYVIKTQSTFGIIVAFDKVAEGEVANWYSK